MKIDRICLLDKENPYLKIKINLTSDLIAGIEIKMFRPDESLIKSWKLAIPENTKIEKDISIEPNEINRGFLVWNAVVCSKNYKVSEGIFKMELIQDLKPLKLSSPIEKKVTGIPPCAIQQTVEFTDALTFIVKGQS